MQLHSAANSGVIRCYLLPEGFRVMYGIVATVPRLVWLVFGIYGVGIVCYSGAGGGRSADGH